MMNVSTNLIAQRLNSLSPAQKDNNVDSKTNVSVTYPEASQNLLTKFLKIKR